MKKNRLLTKQYWLRAAVFFFCFLFVYTLVQWFFQAKEIPFWSLTEIHGRSSFSLLMAMLFAYGHRGPITMTPGNHDSGKSQRTLLDFLGLLGLMLFFLFCSPASCF